MALGVPIIEQLLKNFYHKRSFSGVNIYNYTSISLHMSTNIA